MGFLTRMNEKGIRARAVVAASAVAVAATVWGVAAAVESGHEPAHRNVSREKEAENPGQAGHPGRQQPERIPEGIAHDSESGGNAVNITIDDGPDPRWTPKVLDVLKQHDVKATFCMIGPQAKAHPDLVKQVVAAGHRLCDHTMDHDTAMDKKPVAYQEQQILDAKRLIEEAAGAGAKVDYYRAPGGAFTPTAGAWPPHTGCARSAGTWTPRTSASRARPPSSTPSNARSATARPCSSTTAAATARRPSTPSTRCWPG